MRTLRDGGAIVVVLFILGMLIFAYFDPGDKTGFYKADPPGGQPQEVKP